MKILMKTDKVISTLVISKPGKKLITILEITIKKIRRIILQPLYSKK
jgi:hypothetical protein